MSISPDRMLGIDETLARLLAEVVMQWSYVEHRQAQVLAHLMGANYGVVQYLTEGSSAAATSRYIRDLAPALLHPDDASAVKELLDRSDTARKERNGYAHGLWKAGPDKTAQVQILRPTTTEIVSDQLVTADDLTGLLEDIHRLLGDFAAFAALLGATNHLRSV